MGYLHTATGGGVMRQQRPAAVASVVSTVAATGFVADASAARAGMNASSAGRVRRVESGMASSANRGMDGPGGTTQYHPRNRGTQCPWAAGLATAPRLRHPR